MRFLSLVAAVPVAALAACGGDAGTLVTPEGPSMLVGPTTRVTVSCPNRIKPGQTAQCTAYGYDANGSFTSSSASSWSTSNSSKITVASSGSITGVATGSANISAVVDGVGGSKTVYVEPDIYIDGPDTVEREMVCSFFATVTAGTAPYSYSWSWTNSTREYGYTPNEPGTWTGWSTASSFKLTVTVTDASGVGATVSKTVTTTAPTNDPWNQCLI